MHVFTLCAATLQQEKIKSIFVLEVLSSGNMRPGKCIFRLKQLAVTVFPVFDDCVHVRRESAARAKKLKVSTFIHIFNFTVQVSFVCMRQK